MIHSYKSSGKLLLTGEYLVLAGAEALALPLNLGQTLTVKPIRENTIIWDSRYREKVFLEVVFSSDDLRIIHANNRELATYIQNVLKNALKYIPSFSRLPGCQIEAVTEFPLEWGIGSSSTLISNISEWLNINAFRLNRDITEGSGYDIACAKSKHPILYRLEDHLPDYREVELNLPFKKYIYFVYTGRKQSSREAVRNFLTCTKDHSHFFPRIREINSRIIRAKTLYDFEKAVSEHELILSSVLNQPTIQQSLFRDFGGTVKSLGAWGGDFILMVWKDTRESLEKKLAAYNMQTLFSWDELVKNQIHD